MTDYMVLIFLTALAAIGDLKYQKIPNVIVFPGMLAGLIFSIHDGMLFDKLIGLGILLAVTYLAFSFIRYWIGMGDMKLWMMCTAFTGLRSSFLIFTFSQLLLLAYVLLSGNGVKVWYGFKSILFYKNLPEGTEKIPVGIFFLLAVLLYIPCVMKGASV